MIEVFKTNVAEAEQATSLVSLLQQHFPNGRITFDLEDCDRVLRVESKYIVSETVIRILRERNVDCRIMV